MELEEMLGAITQEKEWYAAQVEDLKEKLADLEQLVYGLDEQNTRYIYPFRKGFLCTNS